MGHSFDCFTRKSFELLISLYKNKIISQEAYIEFSECRNAYNLLSLLTKHFSLAEELIPVAKEYIQRQKAWYRLKRDDSTYFNEWQDRFIDQLFKHRGILSREDCLKDFTDHQITSQICPLEEMEFIISLKLSRKLGRRTIYLFNPEIIHTEDFELIKGEFISTMKKLISND